MRYPFETIENALRKESDIMMDNDFTQNASVKKELLETAVYISNTCDYDYYSHQTYLCERKMKDIQLTWKNTGSAGRQEEMLWYKFKNAQDVFWTKIKIKCVKCSVKDYCGGACLGTAYQRNGNFYAPYDEECEIIEYLYKQIGTDVFLAFFHP